MTESVKKVLFREIINSHLSTLRGSWEVLIESDIHDLHNCKNELRALKHFPFKIA